MPRVNSLYEPPFQKLSRLLRGYMTISGVAKSIGCCYETARTRMQHPEDFTLRELRAISLRGNISKDEIIRAINW